jgi:hypothetical protein
MPTATRLLALVGAAIIAGGIALATGSASAQAPAPPDGQNRVKVVDDKGKDNNQNNNQNNNNKDNKDNKQANGGHNHDAEAAKSDEQKKKDEADAKTKPNNGLDVLGRDCKNSKLEPHDGFQKAPRCVETEFGEVSSADKNPSLLITEAPNDVKAGQKFTITVSTRNLVRDRFLGAAAGGYYLESSFLNGDGIQRGHFHTACRMLASTREAPEPGAVPAFFVATQDNAGGATPDTVTITVPTGMPSRGIAQCTVWAGDGSHRIPMMQRANQTPAIDSVRIFVG